MWVWGVERGEMGSSGGGFVKMGRVVFVFGWITFLN